MAVVQLTFPANQNCVTSEEKRLKILSWLSPLSFQTVHSNILNTTLADTGQWLLSHETYVSWKQQVSGALLWIYGKPGSGKSHLAAQVIEQLKELCNERNDKENDQEEGFESRHDGSPRIRIGNSDFLASDSAELHQPLVRNSKDDSRLTTAAGPATGINQASNAEPMDDPDIDPEAPQRSDRTALAYIYCDSQFIQRSDRIAINTIADPAAGYDTTGLLRSLTKQLYQFLPDGRDVQLLSDLCFETTNEQPTRDQVMKAIRTLIKIFDQTFIVVDGLDECSSTESLEFEGFCGFLASLADQVGTRSSANLLIFSRPGYSVIKSAVSKFPSIEVDEGMNAEDIGRFIDARSKTLTKDSESLKEIRSYLQGSAQGMFLWVSLTIDSIKNERTMKKMKAAARNVPKGLSGAYTDALKRVLRKEASIRDLALKALLWVANSKKPLSESQLLEALVIEPGMTSIDDEDKVDGIHLRTDCEDLLHLKDGHYELQHSSLGEFLRTLTATDRGELQSYGALQDQASRVIVETCITYFKFSAFAEGPAMNRESLNEILAQHPFMEYAGIFWGYHMREALELGNPQLQSDARDLLRIQSSRELLHQIFLSYHSGWVMWPPRYKYPTWSPEPFPFKSGTTPLHILSIFGLSKLLGATEFSPADLEINQPDGFGWYAIDYATRYGHERICSWIVARQITNNPGDDWKVTLRSIDRMRLLGSLIENQWTGIVATLLNHGYKPMEPCFDRTILHMAAAFGYVDMVELFLDSGADPNIQDSFGRTPLIIAAAYSSVDVIKLLLSHSVDVNLQCLRGLTALHMVARSGDHEMIQHLISRGALIQMNFWHESPLHDAAFEGHEQVIETLVSQGAQKEARTSQGLTPFLLAVSSGKIEAVRTFLRNGADVTAVSRKLQTALHLAARNDHLEILSILLANTTGLGMLDQRDENMWTALHLAANRGNTACAIKLLDTGALVDLEDEYGQTPSILGLLRGEDSLVVKLFDEYGANPKHTDHDGATILHVAAKSTRSVRLASLLCYGVDEGSRDRFGKSALQYATELNNSSFVESYTKSVPAGEVFKNGQEISGKYLI